MVALAALARRQWADFVAVGPTRAGLIAYHTRTKFLILAHSEDHYRRLGRLPAAMGTSPLPTIVAKYGQLLGQALDRRPTRGSHINTLQHLAGMCRKELAVDARAGLTRTIDAYRAGTTSLSRARAELRRCARSIGKDYVLAQTYLRPPDTAAVCRPDE